MENLQQQVAEKNLAIDAIQTKNNQLKNEVILKGDQILQLKYDRAHLQAQVNGVEGEKQNLQEVLDDKEHIIFDLQAQVRDLSADLAQATEQQKNVQQIEQQVEELEGFLRYYQMKCRELQGRAEHESPVTLPAQEGGYSPRNLPLI